MTVPAVTTRVERMIGERRIPEAVRRPRRRGLAAEDLITVGSGREGVIWAGASDGLYSFVPGRFQPFLPDRRAGNLSLHGRRWLGL